MKNWLYNLVVGLILGGVLLVPNLVFAQVVAYNPGSVDESFFKFYRETIDKKIGNHTPVTVDDLTQLKSWGWQMQNKLRPDGGITNFLSAEGQASDLYKQYIAEYNATFIDSSAPYYALTEGSWFNHGSWFNDNGDIANVIENCKTKEDFSDSDNCKSSITYTAEDYKKLVEQRTKLRSLLTQLAQLPANNFKPSDPNNPMSQQFTNWIDTAVANPTTIQQAGQGTAHTAARIATEANNSCSIWTTTGLGNCVAAGIDWMFWIINAIIGLVLRLVSWIFDLAIEFSVVNFKSLASSQGVMDVWRLMRDLTNITFIFMLLYAGFMTIFDLAGKNFNPRKIVVNIIVFAVLVNFSAVLVRTAIDVSNVPALMFYNQISIDRAGNHVSIATSLINGSGVTNLQDQNITEGNNQVNNVSSAWTPILNSIAKGLMTTVLYLGLIFVLTTAAINFMLRSFILVILIMTSPIFFIGNVLPLGQVKKLSDQWLKNLKAWCLYAPVYMLGLYMVIVLVQSNVQSGLIGDDGVFIIVFWFGLILTMLFSIDKLAKSLGAEYGKEGGSFEKGTKAFGNWTKKTAINQAQRPYVWGATGTTKKAANLGAKLSSLDTTTFGGKVATFTGARWAARRATPGLTNAAEKGKFGTSQSQAERTKDQKDAHELRMKNMSDVDKARYVTSWGGGVAAYNALSAKDRVAVEAAAKEGNIDLKPIRDKAKDSRKGEEKTKFEKELAEEAIKAMRKAGEKVPDGVDAAGKPKTKPASEAERYSAYATEIATHDAQTQKAIYEGLKNDNERALVRYHMEQNILSDAGKKAAYDAEMEVFNQDIANDEDGKTKAQKAEIAKRRKEWEQKSLRAVDPDQFIDFNELDSHLTPEQQGKIKEEGVKVASKANNKELQEITDELEDAQKTGTPTEITEAEKKLKAKLDDMKKSARGLADLGDLLSNENIIEHIEQADFAKIENNSKDGVNKVATVINKKIQAAIAANPLLDLNDLEAIEKEAKIGDGILKEIVGNNKINATLKSARNNQAERQKWTNQVADLDEVLQEAADDFKDPTSTTGLKPALDNLKAGLSSAVSDTLAYVRTATNGFDTDEKKTDEIKARLKDAIVHNNKGDMNMANEIMKEMDKLVTATSTAGQIETDFLRIVEAKTEAAHKQMLNDIQSNKKIQDQIEAEAKKLAAAAPAGAARNDMEGHRKKATENYIKNNTENRLNFDANAARASASGYRGRP